MHGGFGVGVGVLRDRETHAGIVTCEGAFEATHQPSQRKGFQVEVNGSMITLRF